MDDSLFNYFMKEFPFNREGLEAFVASFQAREYPKGALLLHEGDVEEELRFMDEGIVREFYAADGKEMNINFYTGQGLVTDFASFTHNTPTRRNQQALSALKLRVLPKTVFCQFMERYQCGQVFVGTLFQRVIEQQEQQAYDQLTKSPEMLYQALMHQKSQWLQQIPQYHIASYLRVAPETLSRIRQRLSV